MSIHYLISNFDKKILKCFADPTSWKESLGVTRLFTADVILKLTSL